jgi:hypothetical protein
MILAIVFPAPSVYDVTMGGTPFRLIFREWVALVPRKFARFRICLLLFQQSEACFLLGLCFGVIAEKQSLKLQGMILLSGGNAK